MGFETFLIFLSTLISLNTNYQAQSQSDNTDKKQKNELVQTTSNTDCRRGGWDGN